MNLIKPSRKIANVILLGGLLAAANATSVQEAVQKLSKDAAKLYVAPMVSGFGSNLNAGWYHRSPPAKIFSFTAEGGVIAMGTMLGTGAKTFSTATKFRFDSAQASTLIGNSVDTTSPNPVARARAKEIRQALIDTLRSRDFNVAINGPTVTGSPDSSAHVVFTGDKFGVQTDFGNDTVVVPDTTIALKGVKGLLGDFTSFPLPLFAPQVTVGTVLGTNVTLRWLPTYDFGKTIGKVSFFGFGIQHNPLVWVGAPIPIDLCLGYFHQDLSLGSLFDASTNAYGVDVSKTLGLKVLNITPYGGFQYETATMSFHYDFKQYNAVTGKTEEIPIRFDLDGENTTRWTAGVSIHLLLVNLNFDYNFAKYNSMSAGLMFGI